MRYRPAMRRPGRKRPSLIMYSAAALELRDDGRDEERDDEEEGGRGGVGKDTVAALA